MLYKKLQELKDKSGMSYQDISDKSEVPLPTVKRIISGQTSDPGYSSVIAIVKALNGSIDDIQEVMQDDTNSSAVTQKMCSVYEKNIHEKNQLIKFLLVALIVMSSIFIFLLVWDLLNPNIGFFRTQKQDVIDSTLSCQINLSDYEVELKEKYNINESFKVEIKNFRIKQCRRKV